jgi:hypothetical protein
LAEEAAVGVVWEAVGSAAAATGVAAEGSVASSS